MLWCGCTANHYRRSADKEVYGILQEVRGKAVGQTNAFTIDTPYSSRKPADILAAELIEARRQTNRRVISIEQALELAINNSRQYQASKETLYSTALTLTGRRHTFAPQFFGTSKENLLRSADGQTYGSAANKLGVNQMLMTGGSLGVSIANDLLQYYTGSPRRSAVSILAVNLSQPLLRGFGKNNASVENLTQAERDVVYAVRSFTQYQRQFALEIVNDYFALLAEKDIIRNRYTNYLGRVQSTKRLEARARDRESLNDVDQTRQAELTAKNNYVNGVATYWNSLDQFKIKLGLPLGESLLLDDQVLDDMTQAGLVPAPLDPEAAYRLAVTKQLDVLNAIDQFEDYKRKVRIAADQLRADLKIIGDASLNSEGDTDYTKFDVEKARVGVGLELDLPLDRLNERNDYRATLISFEAKLRSLTLTFDNLRENIQRGLRTLQQRRDNFEIQKNALTLANRRVISTTLLLEAGRAEVRDLVDSQDAQIAAQTAYTAALVDYQQVRLQLMLDIGALDTDQPKFWLKDHLASFLPSSPTGLLNPATASESVVPPDLLFDH